MTRQRLVLSIALAARRSQSHSDVAAFSAHAQSRWAVLSARHISWSATSDDTTPKKVIAISTYIAYSDRIELNLLQLSQQFEWYACEVC